eukprot:PhF_6_TR41311/c0_g1_i1/m.62566
MLEYSPAAQHARLKSETLRSELEDLHHENVAMEHHVTVLQNALTEHVAATLASQAELKDTQTKLYKTSESVDSARAAVSVAHHEAQMLTRQLRESERRTFELEHALVESKSKCALLEDILKDTEQRSTRTESEYQKLRLEMTQLKVENNQLQRDTAQKESDLSAFEIQLKLAKENIQNVRHQHALMQQELESTKAQLVDARTKYDKSSQDVFLQSNAITKLKEIAEREGKETQRVEHESRLLQEEMKSLQHEVHTLQLRCTVLTKTQDDLTEENRKLKISLASKDEEANFVQAAWNTQKLHCEKTEKDIERLRQAYEKQQIMLQEKHTEVELLHQTCERLKSTSAMVVSSSPERNPPRQSWLVRFEESESPIVKELRLQCELLQKKYEEAFHQHTIEVEEKTVANHQLAQRVEALKSQLQESQVTIRGLQNKLINDDTGVLSNDCTKCLVLRLEYEKKLSQALTNFHNATEHALKLKNESGLKEVANVELVSKCKNAEESVVKLNQTTTLLQEKSREVIELTCRLELFEEEKVRAEQKVRVLQSELDSVKARLQATHDAHQQALGEIRILNDTLASRHKEVDHCKELMEAMGNELHEACDALLVAEEWKKRLDVTEKELRELQALCLTYKKDIQTIALSQDSVLTTATTLESQCASLERENGALNTEVLILRSELGKYAVNEAVLMGGSSSPPSTSTNMLVGEVARRKLQQQQQHQPIEMNVTGVQSKVKRLNDLEKAWLL